MVKWIRSFDWLGALRALGVIGYCVAFGFAFAACEKHRRSECIPLALQCFHCNAESGACEEVSCDQQSAEPAGDEVAL